VTTQPRSPCHCDAAAGADVTTVSPPPLLADHVRDVVSVVGASIARYR
jgi:hypothetical protein